MVTFVIVTGPSQSQAQWVQTNGPFGGCINCFAVSGTSLFAGTSGGVYLSTNGGGSWSAAGSDLTDQDVTSLAVLGSTFFAGTNGAGVFLSSNSGASWTRGDMLSPSRT